MLIWQKLFCALRIGTRLRGYDGFRASRFGELFHT